MAFEFHLPDIGEGVIEGEIVAWKVAEGDKADVPAMHGWRRQVYGNAALKLIGGEMAIKFENRKIRIFDLPAGE